MVRMRTENYRHFLWEPQSEAVQHKWKQSFRADKSKHAIRSFKDQNQLDAKHCLSSETGETSASGPVSSTHIYIENNFPKTPSRMPLRLFNHMSALASAPPLPLPLSRSYVRLLSGISNVKQKGRALQTRKKVYLLFRIPSLVGLGRG